MSTSYWDGSVDHVLIWSRGLTASEILQLYAEPFAFLKETKRRTYSFPTVTQTVGRTIKARTVIENKRQILDPTQYEVDWSHPLARGITGCWLLQGPAGPPVNLATRLLESETTSKPTKTSCVNGPCSYFSGTDQGYKLSNSKYGLPGSPGATITAWFSYTNTQGDAEGPILYIDRGTALYTRVAMSVTPAGKLIGSGRSVTESLQNTTSTATLTTLNMYIGNVVVDLPAGKIRTYINGVLDNDGAATFTQGTFADTTTIESRIGSAAYDYKGSLIFVYLHNRILTASEILQLYAEPSCFLRPLKRIVYSFGAAGEAPVSKSVSDTASSVDALGAILAAVPVADVASAADAVSILALLALADSVGAIDTPSIHALLSMTDTAGVTDAHLIAAAMAILDSVSIADAIPVIQVLIPILESLSAADSSPLISAALALLETLSATDTAVRGASISLSDLAAVLDSVSAITALVPLTDMIGVTDASPTISVTLTVMDLAGGLDRVSVDTGATIKAISDGVGSIDGITGLSVSLVVPDSVATTEGLLINVTANVADAAALSEAIGIIAAIAISDIATSVDQLGSVTVRFTIPETVAELDRVSGVSVSLTVSDVAGPTDAVTIHVALSVSDVTALTDSASVVIGGLIIAVSDAVASADRVGALSVQLTVPDTANVTDTLSAISAILGVADSVGLSDRTAINVTLLVTDVSPFMDSVSKINLVALIEAMQAVESVAVLSVRVPLTEGVTAADSISAILVVLSLLDSLGVTDVAIAYNSSAQAQIDSITFTWKRATATFSLE